MKRPLWALATIGAGLTLVSATRSRLRRPGIEHGVLATVQDQRRVRDWGRASPFRATG